jgi:hypothetical protein
MAIPQLSDIYRVIFASWYDGQYGLNIRYYLVDQVEGASGTEFEMANILKTDLGTLYQPLINDEAIFLGVSVRNLTQLPPPAAVTSSGGSLAGTGGTPPLPTQVAGIITLRSGLAGRAHRGRLYIPFPSGDSNDADTDRPNAGYIAAATALANELILPKLIGTLPDRCRIVPIIKQAAVIDTDPIRAAEPRELWATQRRRGDYGARNPPVIPL